jgi:glycosyltransferase involved in cell wall biosynthesis/SAM-dependent methyltransferase
MKFRESALAHKLLDGLEGIEIGGSAHNPFGLKTRNVDYMGGMTVFKEEEVKMCGTFLPVDIVAPGDKLPLEDASVDFVVSSHCIEHFPDPIKTLKEWHRVVRPGGYLYVIAPHKERTFDRDRPRTTLAELIQRHQTGIGPDPDAAHCSVWITEDFVELIHWLGWSIVTVQDSDDKVGNGFAVVIRVEKGPASKTEAVTDMAPIPGPRSDHHLSMTFLMGPTGAMRTGGAACLLEYVRRFQDRGHEVSITTWPQFLWTGNEPFPNLGFPVKIFYDANARRESLPNHALNQTPRDYLGELQFFLFYANLLTPAIPTADLIIATCWDSIIPAWQCGKGKPVHFPQHYDEVFFTFGGDPSASLYSNPLIKMLCRSTFQMPLYRIANSSWLSAEFRRRLGENVPSVCHGIDTGRFHARQKLSSHDGVIRVVTYCRPEKWKGFQDVVPAMHEVMRRYPDKLQWHVYGFAHPDIPPDNSLAPYTFHGALQHEELSKLYAESDIVLCPSWYESFPLPPLEAMACGTAVITTRYGTEDYAMDGHNAIVVRPRVVSDFAVALDGLIRMPDLRARLARNGRAMAESLSWDNAVQAREELLWRIHRNEMPNDLLRGFESGIVDSFGLPFERLPMELSSRDGDLLRGPDGKHYLVESGRLREVRNPAAIGKNPENAHTLDLLSLLRTEQGPFITSLADYFGLQSEQASVM